MQRGQDWGWSSHGLSSSREGDVLPRISVEGVIGLFAAFVGFAYFLDEEGAFGSDGDNPTASGEV